MTESKDSQQSLSSKDVDINTLIVSLVGITAITMVIGIAIGACCIICIMNRYKKNQNQRLLEANELGRVPSSSTHIDMVASCPIQYSPEKRKEHQDNVVTVDDKNYDTEAM